MIHYSTWVCRWAPIRNQGPSPNPNPKKFQRVWPVDRKTTVFNTTKLSDIRYCSYKTGYCTISNGSSVTSNGGPSVGWYCSFLTKCSLRIMHSAWTNRFQQGVVHMCSFTNRKSWPICTKNSPKIIFGIGTQINSLVRHVWPTQVNRDIIFPWTLHRKTTACLPCNGSLCTFSCASACMGEVAGIDTRGLCCAYQTGHS